MRIYYQNRFIKPLFMFRKNISIGILSKIDEQFIRKQCIVFEIVHFKESKTVVFRMESILLTHLSSQKTSSNGLS